MDLLEFPEIISYIQSYSKVFRFNSQKSWIQVFCPYCDDATRKPNPSHGHFYISRFTNFAHCFRCNCYVSILDFLKEIGFSDVEKYRSVFTSRKTYLSIPIQKNINQVQIIREENFNSEDLRKIYHYIYQRLGPVDLEYFKIYPVVENNKLGVEFRNYFNEFVITRWINSEFRYSKNEYSKLYFFQNPFDFFDFNQETNIVITEGPFDLITLYNYNPRFDNKMFYFAINGKSYFSSVKKILTSYFMFGKIHFHIVIDSDVTIKRSSFGQLYELNPNLKFNFYAPVFSKDVNEFNFLKKLEI